VLALEALGLEGLGAALGALAEGLAAALAEGLAVALVEGLEGLAAALGALAEGLVLGLERGALHRRAVYVEADQKLCTCWLGRPPDRGCAHTGAPVPRPQPPPLARSY
jgi:hypothetical protein